MELRGSGILAPKRQDSRLESIFVRRILNRPRAPFWIPRYIPVLVQIDVVEISIDRSEPSKKRLFGFMFWRFTRRRPLRVWTIISILLPVDIFVSTHTPVDCAKIDGVDGGTESAMARSRCDNFGPQATRKTSSTLAS
jgi:hypothetical protein